MTPNRNWSSFKIDNAKLLCLFDVSKDEELREAFNWKVTQPLSKPVHQQEGTKYIFSNRRLQFIKAYQFHILNEEGSTKIFFDEKYSDRPFKNYVTNKDISNLIMILGEWTF